MGQVWPAGFAAVAQVRSWHECDIARSRLDFRFRGKNGHAADITRMTESDPKAVISRAEIPQRSSLLPCRARAIPFCRKHGRYRAVKRRAFITLLGGRSEEHTSELQSPC